MVLLLQNADRHAGSPKLAATICGRALLWLVFMVSLLCTEAQSADITFQQGTYQSGPYKGETLASIYLTGAIIHGDFERFRRKLRELGPSVASVGLMSPGGDVVEAMKIGRLIRATLLETSAPSLSRIPGVDNLVTCPDYRGDFIHKVEEDNGRCVCFSACFLVYAAGIRRAGNFLAIHRPYFDPSYFAGLSSTEADATYNRMTDDVKRYLLEMGVPEAYFNRMLRVASSSAQLLTSDEVERDLSGYLPSYDEWLGARCGRLTPEEEQAAADNERIKQKQLDIRGCEFHELAAGREKVFKKLF